VHDRAQHGLAGEPFLLIGLHHALRVAMTRIVFVANKSADLASPAHVACLRLLEEARQQAKRERMAAEVARRGVEFPVGAPDAVVAQQRRAGLVRQPLNVDHRRGAVLPAGDVGDLKPAGQHDEPLCLPRRRRREAAQQRAQPLVL
jgi:hypothetical protein